MKKACASLFVLFLLVPLGSGAASIPAPAGYVSDYGNMISSSMEAKLNAALRAFEESDSTQIVILTVPSLEGEPVEDYSIKVAEAWKIGQKTKGNGVLFLVSREDRKMRIEVGRGLEGKLTDLMAGRIIDGVAKPRFRAGDFDGGFASTVNALIDATRGEFRADPKPGGPSVPFAGGLSPWVAFVLLFAFFFLFVALARSRARSDLRRDRLRRGEPRGGWYPPYPGGYGGGWSSRGGGDSGSDAGGGFSGGGGDFGGGGASGDW